MFDKYTLGHSRTEYVDRNITITEKRAPTDESVKLLNQFQEKAIDNLLLRGETDNNIVSAKWYIFDNPMGFDKSIHVLITLNGKEYLIKDSLDRFDIRDYTMLDVLRKVYEMIGRKIAAVLLENINTKTLNDLHNVR